jgi:hypothetical protein
LARLDGPRPSAARRELVARTQLALQDVERDRCELALVEVLLEVRHRQMQI